MCPIGRNPRDEIQAATAVLLGAELWTCRRTSDLVAFQFGERRAKKTFRGDLVDVGQYALHIQCAWRIARKDIVVVGSGDLYYPPDSTVQRAPADFDWAEGPNLGDELLLSLFDSDKRQFVVRRVDVGDVGSLHIVMDHDLFLDVLPNETVNEEYWRLFKPGSEEAHFIFGRE